MLSAYSFLHNNTPFTDSLTTIQSSLTDSHGEELRDRVLSGEFCGLVLGDREEIISGWNIWTFQILELGPNVRAILPALVIDLLSMDDTYAKELSRHAIARAAVALSIKSCKEECLDVLSDVIKNLIQTIAVRTRNHAELSERSYGGIQDVIQILENVVCWC